MDHHAHLERLHHAHAGAVRAYVRRRIGDEGCDEVVADVFVVAWQRLADVPEQPRPWLLGVARRVLANRYRSARRQRALYERLAHEASRDSASPSDDDGAGPRVDVEVLRGLAALRPDDRELLLLLYWDDLSHADAAQVLGIRESALAMRAHRARRRLERQLTSTAAAASHPPSPRPGSAVRHPFEEAAHVD